MALFKEKKRLEDEVAVLPRQQPPPPPPTTRPVVSSAPIVIPPQGAVTPIPVPAPQPIYGIEQVTKLMRELPGGNIELVVRVLKKTLESVRISVAGLIQDATRRESELEDKMAAHRRAIAALEDEIDSKRRTIEELEVGYREVLMVKERLNLAMTLDQAPVVVAVPPDAIVIEEMQHTPVIARVPSRG